jgi:hypothetical protein
MKMKKFFSIVCFGIVLLMGGCASSSGNVVYDTQKTDTSKLFWQGDAERSQPRFSAEGQEYIKVSLVEAVIQSRNPANRGKELFFETSEVMVKYAGRTTNYYVSSFSETAEVGMDFYGEFLSWEWFSAVLYRARCFESGGAIFSIDSFIE